MRAVLLVAAVTVLSAPLAAQAVTPEPALTPGQAVLFTLRSAVRAQESYHLEQTQYASDAAKLRLRAEPGVTLTVVSATQRGWIGKATHAAYPGRSCVVFFGIPESGIRVITDFEGRRAKREGKPVCDSF